jgi:hypothetical protein
VRPSDDGTWMPRRVPTWPGSPSAQGPKRHCLQDENGCAIAAVATLAGLPYSHVKEVAFNLREEGLGGMRPDKIVELIRVVTRERWTYHRYSWLRRRRLRKAEFPVPLVLAHIVSPRPWVGHVIIVKKGLVFDSNYESPRRIDNYEHADWMLWGYVAR